MALPTASSASRTLWRQCFWIYWCWNPGAEISGALDHAMRHILCDDQRFGLSFVKLKAASTECNPRWIGFLYQHPCSLSFQPCCYYGVSTNCTFCSSAWKERPEAALHWFWHGDVLAELLHQFSFHYLDLWSSTYLASLWLFNIPFRTRTKRKAMQAGQAMKTIVDWLDDHLPSGTLQFLLLFFLQTLHV